MTATAANLPVNPSAAAPRSISGKCRALAGDIKFAHTVFALPFALLSAVLAARGWPRWGVLALLLVCMVAARTVAMAANRLLDARLDAANPRTARRAIPSGRLSRRFYFGVLLTCAAAFIIACFGFNYFYANPWPARLCVPALLFISAYPLLKLCSRLCHYYLGACLALAPLCAWIAVRGDIAAPPLWMAADVLLWTAGFDILYACQDYAIDVASGLFSVPAKIGIGPALWAARLTHAGCVAMLVMLGISAAPYLGTLYFIGVGAAVILLIIEHSLVTADDLSRLGHAFFTINGIISVVLGTLGIIDVLRVH